jgi:hypothetical protein
MGNLIKVAAGALLATLFLAGSAHACSYEKTETPFAQWGDPRAYVLVPNGDFASGGAGWTLEGEASVASESLSLPPGSSAVSPPICVSRETPFLRAMARNDGVAGSRLQVEILYEGVEATRSRVVGGNYEDWGPTQPLAQSFGLATLGGTESSAQVRLTAVGGDWQVDDFYVDPFARY